MQTKIERLTKFVLFLFPLFLVSIEHWASGWFGVLVLIGFIHLLSKHKTTFPLAHEEKVLLLILVLYFCIFLISSLANGWGQSAIYALGTELRFVLIIPFYLLARKIDNAHKYLLIGSALGAGFSGAQGIFDVFVFNKPLAWGHYGHLFIGPVTVLLVALIPTTIHILKTNKMSSSLLALFGILGLTTVVLSTARSAYLATLVLSFLAIGHYFKGKVAAFSIFALIVTCSSVYFGFDKIKSRVDKGAAEVTAYFKSLKEHPEDPSQYKMGSVGTRLEMWRATKYFFQDSPWFGVGRFNYQTKAKQLVEKGLANPEIANHSHPHNAFVNMLDEKGIIGLISLVLLLYYPLYIFIRTRSVSPESAFAGIIIITAYTVFSLTEASTFIKGNFVAIYLIYLSVFFSWHVRNLTKTNKTTHLSTK